MQLLQADSCFASQATVRFFALPGRECHHPLFRGLSPLANFRRCCRGKERYRLFAGIYLALVIALQIRERTIKQVRPHLMITLDYFAIAAFSPL
jgi:hypothetical protein